MELDELRLNDSRTEQVDKNSTSEDEATQRLIPVSPGNSKETMTCFPMKSIPYY